MAAAQTIAASVPQWAVTHAPAAGAQATTTKAAISGHRLICSYIIATTVGGATVTANQTINLRDGASGTGAILASIAMGIEATAGRTNWFGLGPLNIQGTAGNAMTLEFAGTPGVNGVQSVTLVGSTT